MFYLYIYIPFDNFANIIPTLLLNVLKIFLKFKKILAEHPKVKRFFFFKKHEQCITNVITL